MEAGQRDAADQLSAFEERADSEKQAEVSAAVQEAESRSQAAVQEVEAVLQAKVIELEVCKLTDEFPHSFHKQIYILLLFP